MKVVASIAVLSVADAVSPSFESYMTKFGKSYDTPEEEASAKKCWENNVVDIQDRNDNSEANFDENLFTDMCPEEFAASRLTLKLDQANGICVTSVDPYDKQADMSKTVDWRDHGYVNPVKDQGHCGSCWAFSVIGAAEGAHFKATGKLISLSEQELVSCDPRNSGCNGGMPGEAFEFAVAEGLDSEADYPYTSGDGSQAACDEQKVGKYSAWFSSWRFLPSHSGGKGEPVLLAAIQNEGPISIALSANRWQQYKSGIMSESDCPGYEGVNHAVLAVGYAKFGESQYYIVRNSWNTTWGENGYIRLRYGQNTCGLTTCTSWLIVGGSGPGPAPTPVPPPPLPCAVHALDADACKDDMDCKYCEKFLMCTEAWHRCPDEDMKMV